MKLLRYGDPGKEQPGILGDDGKIRSLHAEIEDISGASLSAQSLARLREINLASLPVVADEVRIGPCVGSVGKFICVGLNYADHARESGMDLPEEPVIFMKATSAIGGPNDNIEKPRGSEKLDWEVELGIVIGESAKYVSEEEASHCIAGYCLINDVSERSFQLEREGQWCKGKGCDTFGPIGPWLVTADEIAPRLHELSMWLEVNGQRFQDGSTSTMVFKPDYLVSYISQFMSLQPGDVISTGTPPGVGFGMSPERYLQPGDQVSLGIEGLGTQKQTVVDC